MRTTLALVAAVAAPLVLAAAPAHADSSRAAVGFGRLFHDGAVVRTVAGWKAGGITQHPVLPRPVTPPAERTLAGAPRGSESVREPVDPS